MAATPPVECLKCKTWVLKVSINCQGCKRKVKKVLEGIDGVYTTTIDSRLQKVTVSGNVEVETLIKKLNKTGKYAEIWPQKLTTKGNESNISNNMHVQNQTCSKKSAKFTEDAKSGGTLPEKPTIDEQLNKGSEAEGGGMHNAGKKKKKKGPQGDNGNTGSVSGISSSDIGAASVYQNQDVGMDQFVYPSNLCATRQHFIPYPQAFHIPPAYASSCSTPHPTENPASFYYVSPTLPYIHANTYVPSCDSFYIFSDANVNACSIM